VQVTCTAPLECSVVALAALSACSSAPSNAPEAVELTVLAAASLTDVLPGVAELWGSNGGSEVSFGFDSSSRLGKQVEAGAPADVLFTADADSMDRVDGEGLLLPGTRRDVLGNTLVLVVPATSTWTPKDASELAAPGLTHLALAGENVPAGRYGRASLQAANVWEALEPRVVTGDNVRTTLAWVARGEAEAGIVYATDARAEPGVRLAFAFPDASHPPIVYPAAVVRASTHPDEAKEFLDFCGSSEGRALFLDAGFTPPPPR
jgi:molybdate transport system substrate-binding protein